MHAVDEETLDKKVLALQGMYDKWDEWQQLFDRQTAMGLFVPSPLERVSRGIDIALEKQWMPPHAQFLDAGSGDGRIVALALVKGFDAYGIEYDERLVHLSKKRFLNMPSSLPTLNPQRIFQGDFRDTAQFDSYGTPFSSFEIIFNYYNSHRHLEEVMLTYSPKGTAFLFYTPEPRAVLFEGFRYVASLPRDVLTGSMPPLEQHILPMEPRKEYSLPTFERLDVHIKS
jgi:hypothetical protein